MPIAPATLPADPSPQVSAALKWVEGVASANFDLLASAIADDYEHVLQPASLGAPPIHGRDAVVQMYKNILPKLQGYVMTILEIVEGQGKVVVHTIGEADAQFGFHYKNEYLFTFNVVKQADGTHKVNKVQEFTDVEVTKTLMKAVGA
ncbi:hypothetical protein EIP91_003163 [Steccherinum ochraceum]|uniref:SnoaL-like domain-containing protein n=1 Tax=Steccherinum ochraceum TaxID=92696 RepID=A0A4R0RS98_9APHY|nr:hypothetical protein EIP91_003163 [Steccherinum ochraceum]